MEVRTVEEAKIASERTGIELDTILEAFNLTDIESRFKDAFKNATTNEERWRINCGASTRLDWELKEQALLDIVKNATDNNERFEIYCRVPPYSKAKGQVLLDILKNAITNEERWKLYGITHFSNIEGNERILQDILKNVTINEERWKVYKEAPPDSKVRKQALREYMEHFEDDN